MRFYLFKRLPLGLRAGISVSPSDFMQRRTTSVPLNYAAVTKALGATSVYVISTEAGHCKIGYSTDPELRLATLQTASPVKMKLEYTFITTLDPRILEAEAHRILDKHRLSGEWFDAPVDHAIEAVNQASANLGRPIGVLTDSGSLLSGVVPRKSGIDWPPWIAGLAVGALVIWFSITHQTP